MQSLPDLTARLKTFLAMRDAEIPGRYLEFRELLREIANALELHASTVPLFPERFTATQLQKAILEAQGIPYGNEKQTKDPPWTKKEKWTATNAKITSLDISKSEDAYVITYDYIANDGKTDSGEEARYREPMSPLWWYWDEVEVRENFSAGKQIPCLFSEENPYRHKVFRPR